MIDTRTAATGITPVDLEAGWLRGGEVWEYQVSWQFPWLASDFNIWDIADARRKDHTWELDLVSMKGRLRAERGARINRTCSNIVGVSDGLHSFCQADISTFPRRVYSSPIDSVVSKRRFIADGFTDSVHDDTYFDRGKCIGIQGANTGLERQIAISRDASANLMEFELAQAFPFTIEVGDLFDFVVGCDLTFVTCEQRFQEHQNSFRGHPDMQGTDALLAGPRAV